MVSGPSWVCSLCTLENPQNRRRCNACDNRRRIEISHAGENQVDHMKDFTKKRKRRKGDREKEAIPLQQNTHIRVWLRVGGRKQARGLTAILEITTQPQHAHNKIQDLRKPPAVEICKLENYGNVYTDSTVLHEQSRGSIDPAVLCTPLETLQSNDMHSDIGRTGTKSASTASDSTLNSSRLQLGSQQPHFGPLSANQSCEGCIPSTPSSFEPTRELDAPTDMRSPCSAPFSYTPPSQDDTNRLDTTPVQHYEFGCKRRFYGNESTTENTLSTAKSNVIHISAEDSHVCAGSIQSPHSCSLAADKNLQDPVHSYRITGSHMQPEQEDSHSTAFGVSSRSILLHTSETDAHCNVKDTGIQKVLIPDNLMKMTLAPNRPGVTSQKFPVLNTAALRPVATSSTNKVNHAHKQGSISISSESSCNIGNGSSSCAPFKESRRTNLQETSPATFQTDTNIQNCDRALFGSTNRSKQFSALNLPTSQTAGTNSYLKVRAVGVEEDVPVLENPNNNCGQGSRKTSMELFEKYDQSTSTKVTTLCPAAFQTAGTNSYIKLDDTSIQKAIQILSKPTNFASHGNKEASMESVIDTQQNTLHESSYSNSGRNQMTHTKSCVQVPNFDPRQEIPKVHSPFHPATFQTAGTKSCIKVDAASIQSAVHVLNGSDSSTRQENRAISMQPFQHPRHNPPHGSVYPAFQTAGMAAFTKAEDTSIHVTASISSEASNTEISKESPRSSRQHATQRTSTLYRTMFRTAGTKEFIQVDDATVQKAVRVLDEPSKPVQYGSRWTSAEPVDDYQKSKVLEKIPTPDKHGLGPLLEQGGKRSINCEASKTPCGRLTKATPVQVTATKNDMVKGAPTSEPSPSSCESLARNSGCTVSDKVPYQTPFPPSHPRPGSSNQGQMLISPIDTHPSHKDTLTCCTEALSSVNCRKNPMRMGDITCVVDVEETHNRARDAISKAQIGSVAFKDSGNIKALRVHGMHQTTALIDSGNAATVCFDPYNGLPLPFLDDGDKRARVGTVGDIKSSLLRRGCQAEHLADVWIENHKKWVVWTLACYDRNFQSESGGRYLTYTRMLEKLHGRYKREIVFGMRPAVRMILNGDVAPSRPMILCVSKVAPQRRRSSACGVDTCDMVQVELTDGWYAINADLDTFLTKYIHEGIIRVGTKLLVSSARLVGANQGVDPLDRSYLHPEGKRRPLLILRANATRLAKWNCRLGFVDPRYCAPGKGLEVKRISFIVPEGGDIPTIHLNVLRCYPLMYIEKSASSRPIPLSEAEEFQRNCEFEKRRLQVVEKICENVRVDLEKEIDKGAPDVWRKHLAGVDKASLTNNEIRTISAWNEKRRHLLERRLREEVCAEMETEDKVLRSSIPFVRAKVHSSISSYSAAEEAILTIWNPSEEQLELLHEGATLEIQNLTVKPYRRNGQLQLSAGPRTPFRAILNPKCKLCSQQRKRLNMLQVHALALSQSSSSNRSSQLPVEFDTVGISLFLERTAFEKLGSIIFISDETELLLCLHFEYLPKELAQKLEVCLSSCEGALTGDIAFENLQMLPFDFQRNCAVARYCPMSSSFKFTPGAQCVKRRPCDSQFMVHSFLNRIRDNLPRTPPIAKFSAFGYVCEVKTSVMDTLIMEVDCGGSVEEWMVSSAVLEEFRRTILTYGPCLPLVQGMMQLQRSDHSIFSCVPGVLWRFEISIAGSSCRVQSISGADTRQLAILHSYRTTITTNNY